MVGRVIDEIKASVEARIAQAHEEAESNTCLGFFFTLWVNHLEMDFFFFGEEAVEEVKRFTAQAAREKTTEACSSLN